MSTDRKKGNYHHIILGAQVEKAIHNNYVFQTKSTYQTYIRVKGYNEVKDHCPMGSLRRKSKFLTIMSGLCVENDKL